MKLLSYKIHLPNGTVINAKNSHNLEIILALNVCRVFQSSQVRIEPVWARREALGVIRENYVAKRNKTEEFVSSLRQHELDCPCADCHTL